MPGKLDRWDVDLVVGEQYGSFTRTSCHMVLTFHGAWVLPEHIEKQVSAASTPCIPAFVRERKAKPKTSLVMTGDSHVGSHLTEKRLIKVTVTLI